MKRIISIICTLSLLAGCIPVIASNDIINVIINEPFDNIATNGAPENIVIKKGLDARVVERSGSDKALYAKADGNPVKISVPIASNKTKMVYSFDIKIDGDPVKGEALALSGNKTTSMLNFTADRKVSLEDGMDIGGYSNGKWTSYAVVIDYDRLWYDLWIDGKKRLSERQFYLSPSMPTNINFNFTCLEEDDMAGIYLDNIMAYEGTQPVKASLLPSKGINTEVLEFDPSVREEKVYDTVFVDSNSKQGIGRFSLVAKTDTIAEWAPMEEGGTPYIHFLKNGTNDVYGDLTPNGLYDDIDKYVYQADIYIVNNNAKIVFGQASNKDAAIQYSCFLYISGNKMLVGNFDIGTIEFGRWVNIAVAVNLITETQDVYVDRKLVAQDVPVHNGAVVPSYIHIGFTSGSSTNSEYYINRIKFYDGNTLRTFDDELTIDVNDTDFFMLESMKRTTNETALQAQELLGNDVVFMANNGKFYANGQKLDYSLYGADSFIDGSKLMTDLKVLEHAFGINLEEKDGYTDVKGKKICVIQKDGSYFADSTEVGKALNKVVYDEADERHFVIISDTSKGYSNATISHLNQEPVDMLWRYMQFDRPNGDEIYEDLKNGGSYKQHPRLLIKKDEIPEFRNRINNTPRLKRILNSIIGTCDSYFEKEPVERKYEGDGFRLFSACADVKYRLFNLCTVYLATGDKKYAERAWLEIETSLNWSDWNLTTHYLDSGEIGPGIAYAYDILYDYLTNEQKAFIRQRLREQYLDYCVGIYTGNSSYQALSYNHTQNNWGAVTGASMLMVAFALVDEESEDSILTQQCKYLITNVLQTFEHLATLVAPEGYYIEGAQYYEFVLQHFGWTLEMLDNIIGKDYNFHSSPGLFVLPEQAMYMSTKNGAFNKGSTNSGVLVFSPESFIYAKLTNAPETMGLYADYRASVNVSSYLPQYLLFYEPDFAVHGVENGLSFDRYYASGGVGVMRSSWTDSEVTYVGMSGGRTDSRGYNDSHFDKGAFIFESQGVRWSLDMGRNGNDTMPYIKRTETHSALVINPTAESYGQATDVICGVIKSESKPRGGYMIYDLTNIYDEWVNDYKRGFLLSDERSTLTVRDEVDLKTTSDLKWNMITKASIEIAPDGKSAILTRDGKKLEVTGVCSAPDWKFEIAEDLSPTGGWQNTGVHTVEQQQKFAAGTRKLVLTASASGKVDITVKLSPMVDDTTYSPAENISMSAWTIPEGALVESPKADAIYINGTPIDGFVSSVKEYNIECAYGSSVPQITATSSTGMVDVVQAPSFADYAIVTVTASNGRKSEYKIGFVVGERIIDGLLGVLPQPSLPANMKFVDIVGVRCDSEPQPENAAVNVTDGNLSTRWSSNVKGATLELDLGKVYDLSGIALAFADGDTRNYKYDIYVSEDKIGYTRIYSGFSVGGTLDYEYLPANVKARYVRYVGFQHKTGIWNSITEIRPVIAQ